MVVLLLHEEMKIHKTEAPEMHVASAVSLIIYHLFFSEQFVVLWLKAFVHLCVTDSYSVTTLCIPQ
jgi:hypothetical protein